MEGRRSQDLFQVDRTVFFSDAVFAIALTLLVVELRVPDQGASGGLGEGLVALWPRILSFLISFLLVSVVWFNHHVLFHHLHRADRGLVLINMVLLLNIVGMPFVSGMLGQYITADSLEDARWAVFAYGGWVTWGGIPFNALWRYASGRPDLHASHSDPAARKALSRHFLFGPLLYALASLAAFVSIWLSLSAFALLILFFFLPPISLSRRPRHD